MELLLFTDREGIEYKLTTDSPMSSYGIPVVRVENESPGDYGPADMLTFAGLPVVASGLVALWARLAGRTPEEIEFAKSFLAQDPNGPDA